MKQTKIVATLGPSSSSLDVIESLINAGTDVFRINFSHGVRQTHQQNIRDIRTVANKLGKVVAIMGDLQGPKIRVSKFTDNKVTLIQDQEFILDASYKELGNEKIVGVDYPELASDLKLDDLLLLDDGKISLKVKKIKDTTVFCKVIQGGELSNNKGINKLGGGLRAPALTTKDFSDIEFASNEKIDYLAVSFVRDATDIALAKTMLNSYNGKAAVIAKIERTEAIDHMESIVEAADGIMVARGDLAVEVGDAQVPALQKKLIKLASKKHKLSIVATQMLESMISSPVATRAEISDVANAVLDGTDAVMLSAETATGKYPILAVATMNRTCIQAEHNQDVTLNLNFSGQTFKYIDQAIAMSSLFSAYHLQAQAIISLTTSGATALWLSRVNSGIPIYAITTSMEAAQKMALYRDVHPMITTSKAHTPQEMIENAKIMLFKTNILKNGDIVLVTSGNKLHKIGGTNTMQIMRL